MSTHTSSHDHHVTPPTELIKNLAKLAFLMALTIAAALVDVGHMKVFGAQLSSAGGSFANNLIAMAIACTKAYLVVSVFMGVKWGSKLIKMWALTGFVWLPLLLGVFGDYFTRSWEPVVTWNQETQVENKPLDEAAFPSEIRNDDKKWEPGKEDEAPAEH